jgi:transglutaminase-like putative cysteine protease
MILEIKHETHLKYTDPVTEAVTEVRMEPVSDEDQSCHSFRLLLSPATEAFRFQDGFRNRVHHFSVLSPHREVSVLAAHVVETHPRRRDPAGSRARLPLDPAGLDLEALGFLDFRGPVRRTPLLDPVLEAARPRTGTPAGDFVLQVSRHVRTRFEYARDVTQASSPIDDLLRHGKGVCQDFAHLMIAVLRSCGVPARYVSGYIHRPNKESQSHAWCEAWLPDLGWVGVDPTNDCVVGESFVKVAVGRDFTDTPPNRGVYRGRAGQEISVRVETRQLDALPTLDWEEELPPPDAPLVVVASSTFKAEASAAEIDQQHQQQQ